MDKWKDGQKDGWTSRLVGIRVKIDLKKSFQP